MGRRSAARVLDLVIDAVGALIGALFVGPLTVAMSDVDTSSSTYGLGVGLAVAFFLWIFLVVAVFVNEFWLVARSGKSLGKSAFNIRVARADTGGAPGWAKSLGRGAFPLGVLLIPPVSIFVVFVLLLAPKFSWAVVVALVLMPYVPMIWNPTRRGLQDKMAGTIVVRAPSVPVAPRTKRPTPERPRGDRVDYRPYPGAPPPRWGRGTSG